MTDVNSEERESDEEQTEGPPPAKKLKQKRNLVIPRIQLSPPLVLSHVQGRSQPSPAQRAQMNLVLLKGVLCMAPQRKIMFLAYAWITQS